MAREEAAARTSDAVQAEYAAAERDGSQTDWLAVTDALQRRLLAEAGVASDQMAAALHALRTAADAHPDEPAFRELPHVRFNRAEAGALKAGDAAPDVPLHPLDGGLAEATTLGAVCAGKPTVVVAGSLS